MKKVVLSVLVLAITGTAFARGGDGHRNTSHGDPRAAGCSPSDGKLFMEFNNARAFIETAGSMWQDRSNGRASYEIPVGGGNHMLYAGALWMGGEDINGQLKLAAHLFRQGNDFWAGPLGDLVEGSGNYNPFEVQTAQNRLYKDWGEGEIIPSECERFDKFFTIRKAEVKQFITWWKCQNGLLPDEDCEDVEDIDAEVLDRIVNWPAHGDESLGQDKYLAPFYDNPGPGETSGNGYYDPINDGDYPWYDFSGDIDCRNDRRVTLFGDETHWWVFNDKGNIHTETGGDPIGMEVRAQAFAFASDDEINDMTFYNYELINRGTQTLYNTYFGQYVDPDVGFSEDDLVGCDVGRGLAYAYQGEPGGDPGGLGQPGYGASVPAIGVDFFEGPYQDNNGIPDTIGIGEGQALNGIGFDDKIVDNERYGMRRFIYFDRFGGAINGDPEKASDFYNYMRGIWKNGQEMVYGNNGITSATPMQADFMFPGDSDTANWGTDGIDPGYEWWDSNPSDRRFVQSAGPFTLEPGAVNNLTVGVVYARSNETELLSSVNKLLIADTKAQALFDNCFELVEPPVAPDLTIQEMENELILYLNNPPGIPRIEDYWTIDKINIITPDSLVSQGIFYDDTFKFEGYQIFQVKDATTSINEIDDIEKARLVAQCDKKNGIDRLINYTFDEEIGVSIPMLMVDGEDAGIRHSFRVTEDLFATGDNRRLVNHKKYYYIAVSYAHNEFKKYDATDPDQLDGQQRPYLRSRISGAGRGIESVVGIPHDPSPEADGTIYTSSYGFQPELTQIEGLGNGGVFLELNEETINEIMAYGYDNTPTYKSGSGPVDVKIIDPLNLAEGSYELGFGTEYDKINSENWWLVRTAPDGSKDTVNSFDAVGTINEQIILEWGLSVTINQQYYEGAGTSIYSSPIGATMTFADSSKMWLTGVEDNDNFYPTNWIRSGNNEEGNQHDPPDNVNPDCVPENWIFTPCLYDDKALDAAESNYEKLLGGIVAPFNLAGTEVYGMPLGFPGDNPATPLYEDADIGGGNESWFASGTSLKTAQNKMDFDQIHEVDIYITSDQSKWTRCPVIEINDNENQTEHGDDVLELRSDQSVDKNGQPDGSGTGMGWFPGYAIDVNTGHRLNMAFAENSWLSGDNGNDMIWNPTSSFADPVGNPLFGGMHYVYVFGVDVDGSGSPAYDGGQWLYDMWDDPSTTGRTDFYNAWRSCYWIFEPMLASNHELFESDVKISMRVNKPYEERVVDNSNNGFPLYRFEIDQPTIVADGAHLESVLDNINVVPNPYYAYSAYETSKLDNRIKITNIPERCEITIFNMRGGLVRSFVKDDPLTSIDWDLKNHQGIPIAGGLYLIHVKVDIEGAPHERVIKWYGALRQPDLDNL